MESKEDSVMDHKVVYINEKIEGQSKDEETEQNQLWQDHPPKEERHFFLKF